LLCRLGASHSGDTALLFASGRGDLRLVLPVAAPPAQGSTVVSEAIFPLPGARPSKLLAAWLTPGTPPGESLYRLPAAACMAADSF
jgi:hypothetical protein